MDRRVAMTGVVKGAELPMKSRIAFGTLDGQGIVETSYIRLKNAKLPLIENPNTKTMCKFECPLCGGDLTPIGWFRQEELHEMLRKCEKCGLAVFR